MTYTVKPGDIAYVLSTKSGAAVGVLLGVTEAQALHTCDAENARRTVADPAIGHVQVFEARVWSPDAPEAGETATGADCAALPTGAVVHLLDPDGLLSPMPPLVHLPSGHWAPTTSVYRGGSGDVDLGSDSLFRVLWSPP